MLVKHLIEELLKCDPEASVWFEECDYHGIGSTGYIETDNDGSVTICTKSNQGSNRDPPEKQLPRNS
jgi:hypothetical protein